MGGGQLTLPIEQGEKASSPSCETGDMMNWPPASHVVALSGQHWPLVLPPGHVWDAQSWTAPRLCWRGAGKGGGGQHERAGGWVSDRKEGEGGRTPVSCATTCHSTGEKDETAVPLTAPEPCSRLSWTQTRPSQATPTSVPLGQPLIRWPRPALSHPLDWPRQRENSDRRSLSVRREQSTFHVSAATAGAAVQLELVDDGTYSSTMPSETLKASRNAPDARFQLDRIACRASSAPPWRWTYAQSAATPV